MEHGSVTLVILLFIVLLLVGGWILYTYEVNNSKSAAVISTEPRTPHRDSNIETPTTTKTSSADWLTATATVGATEITFQYPLLLPLDTTEVLYLVTSPGYPNYSFPLTAAKDINGISSVEITTDFKYIFYTKRDADYHQRLTLYKATVSTKKIEKITEYDLQLLKLLKEQQGLPDEQTGINPVVISDFTVYNKQQSDTMLGTIATLETNTLLYTGPCGVDRRGNVSISPDKLHIAWSCAHDGVYISDWKSTKKIVDYTDNTNGTVISFVNNERVRFGNITESDSTLLVPYHSVNIDGTDLRL